MIRKLLLPALAALVLAGCASYQYRGGAGGDYYYGQPTTDYRYYGSPYGAYGYGYPYGWSGSVGYGFGYYRNPYYRYYGYPRYPRSPYQGHGNGHGGHYPGNGSGNGSGNDPGHGQHSDRQSPWRDLGSLRERSEVRRTGERRVAPVIRNRPAPSIQQQQTAPPRRSAPPVHDAPRQPRAKRDARLVP